MTLFGVSWKKRLSNDANLFVKTEFYDVKTYKFMLLSYIDRCKFIHLKEVVTCFSIIFSNLHQTMLV